MMSPALLPSPPSPPSPPLPPLQSFGKDDCIGCYIDCDNGIISFSKNDQFLGDAFSIPKNLIGTPFYPAVVLKASMRSGDLIMRPST